LNGIGRGSTDLSLTLFALSITLIVVTGSARSVAIANDWAQHTMIRGQGDRFRW
jgi:hypothetical protein